MDSFDLKYGCNPNQKRARIYVEEGKLPLKVLNGRLGYINTLDALNGYQLVRQLDDILHLPAATSFKHVSPAGAAVYVPLSEKERDMYFIKGELSELAIAYTRARGADRMSSFGDFISLSRECDLSTAKCIAREVSDGVIAPSYSEAALEVLKKKRNGTYTILQMDENYVPCNIEKRTVYGITLEQDRNTCILDENVLKNFVTENRYIPDDAVRDLIVAMVSLKYTQSNSVCFAKNGQTIGVGAGQQSRIHCTRLAGAKADLWNLRQSEKVRNLPFIPKLSRNEKDNAIEQYLSDDPEIDVFDDDIWPRYFTQKPERYASADKKEYLSNIDDISLASDAFFPFSDNIDRAARSGVRYISQPGGSLRDAEVIAECNRKNIAMVFTETRLFHH